MPSERSKPPNRRTKRYSRVSKKAARLKLLKSQKIAEEKAFNEYLERKLQLEQCHSEDTRKEIEESRIEELKHVCVCQNHFVVWESDFNKKIQPISGEEDNKSSQDIKVEPELEEEKTE